MSAAAPVAALAGRTFRDARTRTLAFAYLFALYAYVQPAAYRHTYPRLTDRVAFAHSFADNDALRLLYGYPYDPTSVGGYSAWRVGGTLAIAAAMFGVLAGVSAMRAEEDSGRSELLLSGPVSRGRLFGAALAAIALASALLWAAQLAGFLAAGLAPGPSAYLALTVTAVVPVFAGVGALASQLAPTRRSALELGTAVAGVSLLLRVVADAVGGAGPVRWLTPLGWAEQLRPFTGARPLMLLPTLLACALLLATARAIALRRDVGEGLFGERQRLGARTRILRSPIRQAALAQRGSAIAWSLGVGVFALVLGGVSGGIGSAGIPRGVRRELAKLGAQITPEGYIALVFIFFVLALSLFVCTQVNAARQEEAEGRLERLLALPLSKRRWLGGRALLAAGGACVLALLAGALTCAGAALAGVSIPLTQMLATGGNCLPVALLFLGVALLCYALMPRVGIAVAYCLVAVAFMWQLVGSLVGAPRWLLDATPFAHIALLPTQSFRSVDAAAMLTLALAAGLAGLAAFSRRDLTGE